MASVLVHANLLRCSPGLYSLDGDSVTLLAKEQYTGVYFDLVTAAGTRVHAHATIGHWSQPGHTLESQVQERIVIDFKQALTRAWSSSLPLFADVEAVDLGHRAVCTLHVGGGLSAAMWALQQKAAAAQKTSEKKRRTNFHISVDAVA